LQQVDTGRIVDRLARDQDLLRPEEDPDWRAFFVQRRTVRQGRRPRPGG
jgi:hypothetical protein